MLACAHAVRTSAPVADLMHRMGGTNGIYERSRLERHFRDAHTVRHHGFVSEARLETVGQVYLGIEPEFGFVGFGAQRRGDIDGARAIFAIIIMLLIRRA